MNENTLQGTKLFVFIPLSAVYDKCGCSIITQVPKTLITKEPLTYAGPYMFVFQQTTISHEEGNDHTMSFDVNSHGY